MPEYSIGVEPKNEKRPNTLTYTKCVHLPLENSDWVYHTNMQHGIMFSVQQHYFLPSFP